MSRGHQKILRHRYIYKVLGPVYCSINTALRLLVGIAEPIHRGRNFWLNIGVILFFLEKTGLVNCRIRMCKGNVCRLTSQHYRVRKANLYGQFLVNAVAYPYKAVEFLCISGASEVEGNNFLLFRRRRVGSRRRLVPPPLPSVTWLLTLGDSSKLPKNINNSIFNSIFFFQMKKLPRFERDFGGTL